MRLGQLRCRARPRVCAFASDFPSASVFVSGLGHDRTDELAPCRGRRAACV